MLQLQITQEKVRQLAADEGKKLIDNAELLRQEIDELQRQTLSRSDEAFDHVLEDFNSKADQLTELLRQSREEQEANNKAFSEWERSVAIRRSQGLFFKSLHNLKAQQRSSMPREDKEAVDRTMRKLNASSRQADKRRPLLTNISGGLAVLLAITAATDAWQDPSMLWRSALYGLLAIMFGASFLSGRSMQQ
ncbi:hypothetical protein WJX73_003399 [Symbiochloris irregularis]|uniref:Uncharacterized protein n=1 Tax=Symbiochloris irregularis TaxID=706552 RepID=A0AAW1NLT2_9CHLO